MEFSIEQILIGGLTGLFVLLVLVYQVIPYRKLSLKRPYWAIFPKYSTDVAMPATVTIEKDQIGALEQVLLVFGFEERGRSKKSTCYIRYSPNGKLSYSIPKARITVVHPDNNRAVFKFSAPLFLSYDRGEYWSFLNELKGKIESFYYPSSTSNEMNID